MIKEYPIIIQAKDNDGYEEAVVYINKVARPDDNHREKRRVNYYLEGDMRKKIRITPSKKTIELTLTVDEEIIKTLKNISGVRN